MMKKLMKSVVIGGLAAAVVSGATLAGAAQSAKTSGELQKPSPKILSY